MQASPHQMRRSISTVVSSLFQPGARCPASPPLSPRLSHPCLLSISLCLSLSIICPLFDLLAFRSYVWLIGSDSKNCTKYKVVCDYRFSPDSGSDASGRRRLDDSDFVRYRTSEGSESRESTASCNSSAPAMNAVALDTGTAGISGQDLFSST